MNHIIFKCWQPTNNGWTCFKIIDKPFVRYRISIYECFFITYYILQRKKTNSTKFYLFHQFNAVQMHSFHDVYTTLQK